MPEVGLMGPKTTLSAPEGWMRWEPTISLNHRLS